MCERKFITTRGEAEQPKHQRQHQHRSCGCNDCRGPLPPIPPQQCPEEEQQRQQQQPVGDRYRDRLSCGCSRVPPTTMTTTMQFVTEVAFDRSRNRSGVNGGVSQIKKNNNNNKKKRTLDEKVSEVEVEQHKVSRVTRHQREATVESSAVQMGGETRPEVVVVHRSEAGDEQRTRVAQSCLSCFSSSSSNNCRCIINSSSSSSNCNSGSVGAFVAPVCDNNNDVVVVNNDDVVVTCGNGYCCEADDATPNRDINRTCSLDVVRGCDENEICRHVAGFRRPKLPTNKWLRLGTLLLVLLLAIASVQSAPAAMTLEGRRLGSSPKWMNPCGFAAEEFEGDVEVVQLNDAMLLGNIVMQAKTALNYAQSFRDDYIKRTFNTDYADLHLTWKDNHYDWLPGPKQIPKQLGEQLEQEFLDKLEVRMLDTALLDAYEYMQRYAVGLEQIAWDQEDHGLEFRKKFKDTEYNLRSVLCELQMALAERQVAPRADVNRDVMSSDYRGMSDATFRNLRDWIIFRDYMNGLEYIIQVFEHLVRSMES